MKIVKKSVLSLIISLLFVATASASLLSAEEAKESAGMSLTSLGELGEIGGDPISNDLYLAALKAKNLEGLKNSKVAEFFAPALLEAAWSITH